MKITSVKGVIVAERALFVRMETDAGIVGYGECSPMDIALIATAVSHNLGPRVVGLDPFSTERIRETLLLGTYKLRGRIMSIGISGIETAAVDVMGKALGVPAYRLLGGAYRSKIEVYASFMRRDLSPVEVAARAASAVQKGFGGVKIRIGARFGFDLLPDNALETVKEVRAAIGDDVKLMVDANSAYSASRAIELGRRLEEYGVFHFEEPVPEHDMESLVKVSAALDMPVAAGEQNHTTYEFKQLLVADAVDIVQPDVTKAGGILECKKIAAMAEAFGKFCTPHNTSLLLGCAAALHFVGSTPNCRYPLEYNAEPNDLPERVLLKQMVPVDGMMSLPECPGLGVAFDEGFLHANSCVV